MSRPEFGGPDRLDSYEGLLERLELEASVLIACESLAIAIAAAINLWNPSPLFVHGRLFEVRDGLFEAVCELTRRRALAPSLADCRILRARWSKQQGAVAGAIHHLIDAHGPILAESMSV